MIVTRTVLARLFRATANLLLTAAVCLAESRADAKAEAKSDAQHLSGEIIMFSYFLFLLYINAK